MISILSILIVLFIAISNVEEAPIRKPFPSAEADNSQTTEEKANPFSREVISKIIATTEDSPVENNIVMEDGRLKIVNPDPEDIQTPNDQPDPSESLLKNVSAELLGKVGYQDFVIKPRPFSGQLFEQFDLSMLSYLDIVDKKIIQLIDGNEIQILRVYEFNFSDDSGTQEIYDFLKAKIKDELGVTVNESNQFGLSSFYINFQEERSDAFLVVKTRSNVYALSYPKDKDGNKTNFELISRLLSELI